MRATFESSSCRYAAALIPLALLVGLVGCKPDYPKCREDSDCRESDEGQRESRLLCVGGTCRQCREAADCGDPSMTCNAGACVVVEGYCTTSAECGAGGKCIENRCAPECSSDQDCPPGARCRAGSCEKPELECTTTADCDEGRVCTDGICILEGASAECTLERVYFSYDQAAILNEARAALDANAACLKQREEGALIAGHADERGSSEYNLALGERRAASVRDYLRRLGVDDAKLRTISYGEEQPSRTCGVQGSDSCHRENRRVELTFQ